jgi:hypothetical protein
MHKKSIHSQKAPHASNTGTCNNIVSFLKIVIPFLSFTHKMFGKPECSDL